MSQLPTGGAMVAVSRIKHVLPGNEALIFLELAGSTRRPSVYLHTKRRPNLTTKVAFVGRGEGGRIWICSETAVQETEMAGM